MSLAPLFGGAFLSEETMSKKLLKEGLKQPKEQTVKEKPYTVKASVQKAVKDLKAMSKDRGSLPL